MKENEQVYGASGKRAVEFVEDTGRLHGGGNIWERSEGDWKMNRQEGLFYPKMYYG